MSRPLAKLAYLYCVILIASCSTSTGDLYQVPDSTGFATFEAMYTDKRKFLSSTYAEFAVVRSVNRLMVPGSKPSEVRAGLHVEVAEGFQKIHILACEATIDLLAPSYLCVNAVFRIDVVAGSVYRVKAAVSKNKDHADVWIEDVESGDTVAGPIRVTGLERG